MGIGKHFKKIKSLFSKTNDRTLSLRDTLEELIEEEEPSYSAHDDLEEMEKTLLGNILRLRDVTADEIMVPRADIIGINHDSSLEQTLQVFQSNHYTCLPVYRETLDDIQGIITAKAVIEYLAKNTRKGVVIGKSRTLLRKPLFVSPSARPLDVWLKMRSQDSQVALVVDEYGGVDGLITLEDIVQVMLENIQPADPHEEANFIIPQQDGTIITSGRAEIQDVEEVLGKRLSRGELFEDIDTIGGLVSVLAGSMPRTGDTFEHPAGVTFEVKEADPRKVKRVLIRPTELPALSNED